MITQDNVSDKSWKAQWQTFLRQEVESLIQTVWDRIPPSVRESVVELAEAETLVQTLSTRISQGVVTRWAAAHAADDAIPCCPTCGQSMRRVASDRPRAIIGFFGDYRLARAYYACTQGHGGNAPADRRWGLGPDHVSPKLGALALRFAVEAPFDQASALLQAALGVTVDDETLRRIAHRVGGVAEAEEQAAIAAVAAGHGPDPKAASESPSALVVAVDGVMAQMTPKQWREGKIGVCLPLINDSSAPADGAGTESLLQPVGTPDYCIGFESRPEFWHRVYTHALQAGLDARSCRLVALLGDGASWIWDYGPQFLGGPGKIVVEIVDIYHAREYLWEAAHALFGEASPEAEAWARPLSEALETQGPDPVLAALEARTEAGTNVPAAVTDAIRYFQNQHARMDYPRYRALGLPIGSGIVEGACKSVFKQRLTAGGMRWTASGAQAIATLRARHRSGRWQEFWDAQPYTKQALGFPSLVA